MSDLLAKALRQYRHNDNSGFVFGYDYEETQLVVRQLQATNKELLGALKKIVAAHNSEENAGGGFLSWDELTQAEQAITNAKQVMGDKG